MGLLKRMVGLEGPDPKKRKNGWGKIYIYPKIYAKENKVRKDLKKLLPYITQEESCAVLSKFKGLERASILIDEKTFRGLEHGRLVFKSIDADLANTMECCGGRFQNGCGCGLIPDTNLKDYLILTPENSDEEGWSDQRGYCDE